MGDETVIEDKNKLNKNVRNCSKRPKVVEKLIKPQNLNPFLLHWVGLAPCFSPNPVISFTQVPCATVMSSLNRIALSST